MPFLYNDVMKYDVVIVASGKGERANLGYNKVFYKMNDGRTVLEHSASLFIEDDDCKNIIIVTNQESMDLVFNNNKVIKVVGGAQRKDSVYNGLQNTTSDYVMIHDGARPFLNIESLNELKKTLLEKDAVILAKKAIDTIKVVNNGVVEKTIDRNSIYMAETPQCFKTSLIKKCYEECVDINFTDDASLAESLGYKVYVVEDKFNNKKLTTSSDFENL